MGIRKITTKILTPLSGNSLKNVFSQRQKLWRLLLFLRTFNGGFSFLLKILKVMEIKIESQTKIFVYDKDEALSNKSSIATYATGNKSDQNRKKPRKIEQSGIIRENIGFII